MKPPVARPRRLHAGLPLLLVATACSSPEPTPTDIDVANHEPAWTTPWTLEEDLRLGGAAVNDTLYEFLFPWEIKVDETGHMYVVADGVVRVFDQSGAFVTRIGRLGDGPGELRDVIGMSFAPDERVWLFDRSGLFHVFERDGSFVEAHRRHARPTIMPWRGEFTADGRIVDWARPAENSGDMRNVDFLPIAMSFDPPASDTLPPLEFSQRLVTPPDFTQPYGPGVTFYSQPEGDVWFARTDEYVIRRRTLAGDTTFAFSLESARPEPLSDEEVATAVSQVSRIPDIELDATDLPDVKPMIHRIFGDGAGHIYVIPELDGVAWGTAVDAFTQDGTYQGRLELPTPARLPLPVPAATFDHLYFGVEDDLGVVRIVRYRIRR